MQDPRMKPVELRMPRNFDLESFNPHGISVYTDTSGKSTYHQVWLHTNLYEMAPEGQKPQWLFFQLFEFVPDLTIILCINRFTLTVRIHFAIQKNHFQFS